MEFGINMAPGADAWKLVKRAEELGFTHGWLYDTQLLNADVVRDIAGAIDQLRDLQRAWAAKGRAEPDLSATVHATGCILAQV